VAVFRLEARGLELVIPQNGIRFDHVTGCFSGFGCSTLSDFSNADRLEVAGACFSGRCNRAVVGLSIRKRISFVPKEAQDTILRQRREKKVFSRSFQSQSQFTVACSLWLMARSS